MPQQAEAQASDGNQAPHEASSDLPAPYVAPWLLLRRDLIAVVAGLRLKARELWRLNRQGHLPSPSFVPVALAPLVWPATLLVALMALILMTALVVRSLSPSLPPHPRPMAVESTPAVQSTATEATPVVPAAEEPAADEPTVSDIQQDGDEPETPALAPFVSGASPQQAIDPWLNGLDELDRSPWIQAVQTDPATLSVNLVLDDAFSAQALHERERLAECWWSHSQALGFEQLQLEGPAGMLLGRNARVGSGMILLSHHPSS